jgi:hypothetical protein
MMTPGELTNHFTEAELDVEHAPIEVKGAARVLCYELLEPIRAKFGPLKVTSGYRPPERNAAAGGKQTSFHLYLDGKAAADFQVMTPGVCLQECFDWIRLKSGLKFDKVILEYPPGSFPNGVLLAGVKPRCIHIQLHVNMPPRRLAFVGETGASQIYLPVTVGPLGAHA